MPTTVTASGTKLYHCRYRYTTAVGCEKTFTTLGHASRHSKIHTCEKGIQCIFPSCPRKFTRADNMKQHLETHLEDSRRVLRKNASAPAMAMRRGRCGAGDAARGARVDPRYGEVAGEAHAGG
ncbi:hypothetical protein VE03_10542 [Pseudogymnoascus sp. 23342-1-I1]|nr:hypothetical protein VE03_10542 [Pseudogymnoascus sp. 23342-1-I1]